MNWEKLVVRRTLELAADDTGALLQFLLQRLEAYPDALEAIEFAVKDMAALQECRAAELKAYARRRRGGAEIVRLNPKK